MVIEGQVKNPGKYPFHQNLFLSDLINATMSRMNEDFSKTMDLSKILIFRKSQKKNRPEKLVVQLDEDIMLKNGDHITISKEHLTANRIHNHFRRGKNTWYLSCKQSNYFKRYLKFIRRLDK